MVRIVPPPVLFVDASAIGTRSGLSWANAFPTLQEALAAARPNTELWVAAGVYYPDEGLANAENVRDPAFRLRDRVSIYGGFTGRESERSQRDPTANLTILSGDLDQDDPNPDGNFITENFSALVGDNASSVVLGGEAGAATVLDGVVITAGNADGSRERSSGGGLHVSHHGPTVIDCSLLGNRALSHGGGSFFEESASMRFQSCSFSGNYAELGGAAGLLAESAITFVDCTFAANRAERGGALGLDQASLRMVNCRVLGNRAGLGGGLHFEGTFNPRGTIELHNCEIRGNRASTGGGVSVGYGPFSFTNCVLAGNFADARGGALHTDFEENGDFLNCILAGNQDGPSASGYSATLSGRSQGRARFSHCIFEHSGGSQGWVVGLATDLGNNLDVDPRFVAPTDPSTAPTVLGSAYLQPDSPAIDAGWAALPPDFEDLDGDGDRSEPLPLDLAGRPRVLGNAVDLGVFEHTAGGPAATQPLPQLELAPDSGRHPALVDLRQFFDDSAVSFSLASLQPAALLDATVDPTTGLIDVEITADQFGEATLVVAATNAGGFTTYGAVTLEIFPPVVYVDASARGSGSGLSWENAIPTLQSALRQKAGRYETWGRGGNLRSGRRTRCGSRRHDLGLRTGQRRPRLRRLRGLGNRTLAAGLACQSDHPER